MNNFYYKACVERFDGTAWKFVCWWCLPEEYELLKALDDAGCGVMKAAPRLSHETHEFFRQDDLRSDHMRIADGFVCLKINLVPLGQDVHLMVWLIVSLGQSIGMEKVRLVFWSNR
jgi:hypothetical protein